MTACLSQALNYKTAQIRWARRIFSFAIRLVVRPILPLVFVCIELLRNDLRGLAPISGTWKVMPFDVHFWFLEKLPLLSNSDVAQVLR